MAKHAKTPRQETGHDDAATSPSADRRRWLKAGLSTPPILMTVASRPVLASTCVPPSAYVSLGTSAPGTLDECRGLTPEGWLDTNPWPNGYSHGTRFNDCFEPNLAADPPNSNANPNANGNGPKLTEILGDVAIDGLSDPIRTVARYVTAALLNNAGGKVPEKVLRAMTIQHIWAEFAKTGYFAPTSGTRWSAAEIVDYLRSTMTGA